MSNNYNPFINQENNNNNNLEPFDKIEQGQKRYIPNIPSVISDMKKNNIKVTSEKEDENIKDNKEEKTSNEIKENIYETKEKEPLLNNEDQTDNQNSLGNTIVNYWNTFRNNKTVSTIINPFQDDSECVNKIYKIYSCITITLILIVILFSITLI